MKLIIFVLSVVCILGRGYVLHGFFLGVTAPLCMILGVSYLMLLLIIWIRGGFDKFILIK